MFIIQDRRYLFERCPNITVAFYHPHWVTCHIVLPSLVVVVRAWDLTCGLTRGLQARAPHLAEDCNARATVPFAIGKLDGVASSTHYLFAIRASDYHDCLLLLIWVSCVLHCRRIVCTPS